jgi:hypothetical protein
VITLMSLVIRYSGAIEEMAMHWHRNNILCSTGSAKQNRRQNLSTNTVLLILLFRTQPHLG